MSHPTHPEPIYFSYKGYEYTCENYHWLVTKCDHYNLYDPVTLVRRGSPETAFRDFHRLPVSTQINFLKVHYQHIRTSK